MKNRVNNMGTLHMIGALIVMYGHYFALLGQNAPILYGYKIQAIGVRIIFLISGYLIMKSIWNTKGNRAEVVFTYSIKRISRIYPEYLVCIVASALLIGPAFTSLSRTGYWQSYPSILHYITSNLMLSPTFNLPGMFENNPYPNVVNGSVWTLPIEIAIYILILLVFLLCKNEKIKKYLYVALTIGIIGLYIICRGMLNIGSAVFYGTNWMQFLYLTPYYLIGGLAYLFKAERYANLPLASVLLLVVGSNDVLFSGIWLELIGYISLSYFVISLMLETEQRLSCRWLKSEYAYGVYLYGFVIQQCVIQVFYSKREVTMLNFHVTFVISALITYFIAVLSHKWIYLPIHKVIHRYLHR